MNNGKIVYTKPGSDEVIGEATFATGHMVLARTVLTKNGVSFPDNALVAGLAALIAGERAKVEGISAGNLHHIDDLTVAEKMCEFDFDIVSDEDDDETGEVPEADANPTATSGESC